MFTTERRWKRWNVRLTWEVIGDRPECVGISLEPVDKARPARARDLRVPFGELINKERPKALRLAGLVPPAPVKAKPLESKQRGRGRPPLPLTEYEKVARVYTTARRRGKPPTKAVEKEFQISYSAATKRVARARDLGLLPPTSSGVALGAIIPSPVVALEQPRS